MRKTLKVLILLAAIPAGAAFAGDDCSVPLADWQPREAVVQLATQLKKRFAQSPEVAAYEKGLFNE